MVQPVKSQTII